VDLSDYDDRICERGINGMLRLFVAGNLLDCSDVEGEDEIEVEVDRQEH